MREERGERNSSLGKGTYGKEQTEGSLAEFVTCKLFNIARILDPLGKWKQVRR